MKPAATMAIIQPPKNRTAASPARQPEPPAASSPVHRMQPARNSDMINHLGMQHYGT